MLLLGLIEFACLIGIPVTLIGFAIQAIRKRDSKEKWAAVCIGFLAVMVICVIVTPTSETTDDDKVAKVETTEEQETPSPAETEETPQEEVVSAETEEPAEITEKEKTEAEEFAEKNGVSVELAESIEAALAESDHKYKLHQVYEWKQIDDWANGERYTGWLDMEYVWVFYVSGDSLQSIRQQKGLSYIWSAE